MLRAQLNEIQIKCKCNGIIKYEKFNEHAQECIQKEMKCPLMCGQ